MMLAKHQGARLAQRYDQPSDAFQSETNLLASRGLAAPGCSLVCPSVCHVSTVTLQGKEKTRETKYANDSFNASSQNQQEHRNW
jgi:hypothetical protein